MIVAVDPGVSGAIALNDWRCGRLEVIPMPEQTGKTRCCATCAACWSTTKNVAFLEH